MTKNVELSVMEQKRTSTKFEFEPEYLYYCIDKSVDVEWWVDKVRQALIQEREKTIKEMNEKIKKLGTSGVNDWSNGYNSCKDDILATLQ